VESIKYIVEDYDKGNVVIRIFNKSMSKKDIIGSFDYMFKNNMLNNDTIGLITDTSNSDLELDISDLEKMTSFISENELLSKIKIAVVGNSPEKILFPTLANFTIGDLLIPFSSIELAREWILE